MLLTHARKVYICDVCKSEISAPDVTVPPLPPGWSEARDFYGNAVHSCRNCREQFPAVAQAAGMEMSK